MFICASFGSKISGFQNFFMTYYHTFNKQFIIKRKEELEANSFLYNEHIKVGNRAISKRCFIDNIIFYIKQLMNGDRFLTYLEFLQKFNVRINFLEFISIILGLNNIHPEIEC